MENKVFFYEFPVHITNFINDDYIDNFAKMVATTIEKVAKNHSDFGVVTVAKNEDYGFLMVDYGLVIFSLMEHVKRVCRVEGDPDGEKYAEMIGEDFLTNKDEKLAKNGKFLVELLSYFGISFLRKNSKGFYSRTLIKNLETGNFTLMNSVGFNAKEMMSLIGKSLYERHIQESLDRNNVEVFALYSKINTLLNALEGTVEIAQFWSREDGLNSDIFK